MVNESLLTESESCAGNNDSIRRFFSLENVARVHRQSMTESLMYGDDAYEVHDAAVKSVSLLTSLIPGEVISFAGFRVTVLLEEVMVCKRCLALLVACVVILSPDAGESRIDSQMSNYYFPGMSPASADQSQTLNDHEDEYTITIKSPNLTVTVSPSFDHIVK